ncbi:hypothetical protein GCM10023088_64600 [Actinomadura verrucosospora]
MDASDAALYATLLREAPEGLAFFDRDLRCRRANDALAELLDVRVRDLQQRRPSEVLPEALAAAFETALRKVIADDRPVTDLELVVPVRDADAPGDATGDAPGVATAVEERILACTWLPAKGGGDERPGVVLTALDVTERRRAEEVIRRKEQRYRSLVEASAQVVWVAAPAGGAIDDAPEWRAITGQTPDDYAVGGWLSVVHPEDRPASRRTGATAWQRTGSSRPTTASAPRAAPTGTSTSGPCPSGAATR